MIKLNLGLIAAISAAVIIGSNSVMAENQDIHILLNNGSSLLYAGQYEQSIPFFDQVLKIQPNNTDALDDKGVALGGQGEYNQSISYFDRVLQIEPKSVSALNNKAAVLVRIGKYPEAMSVIDQVLQIDPKNVVALSNKKAIQNNNTLTSMETKLEGFSVFWNIQLYDSEGHFVGYLEPNKIVIPNLSLLNAALDTDTTLDRSIIEKDGKKYEKIVIESKSPYSGPDLQVTKTGYLKGGQWLFYAYHNGYVLSDGDTPVQKWIIIRPLK